MSDDLLFELGCEELPSGSVRPLADAFADHLLSAFDKAALSYTDVQRFATPRRIGIVIRNLQDEQQGKTVIRKGPALTAAYKEGQPTAALSGFAKSCGVEVEALSTMETDKGDWVIYEAVQQGEKTKDLLPSLIRLALTALPIPKPMRWGNSDLEFIRPVHWAVLLYGEDLIETELLGVQTGRKSRGHRFHSNHDITINSPKNYEDQLHEAYVIADFDKRKVMIKAQVQQLADDENARAQIPAELLDEVTSIVEWPNALLANFDKTFLTVPPEALVASMQDHQKCFALKSQQGELLPRFITVSNIESNQVHQVINGNEKVMRARLSDAAFFYHQDKKQPLQAYADMTAHVVFQKQLGSLEDKTNRICLLMRQWIDPLCLEKQHVDRAAELSKCDLMTGMVGEFPELQGLMGFYYALNDGEDKEVALALNEHYLPRFSGDELPQTSLGLALSLADRLDTLVGIFAIGQKPSGVKDPFKLRRHALAIARLLASHPAKLQLSTVIAQTAAGFANKVIISEDAMADIKQFILERWQSYYQLQGYSVDVVNAVRACQNEWLYDAEKRLSALRTFVNRPEAASLSAACKRVNNILHHASISSEKVREALLQDDTEKTLFNMLVRVDEDLQSYYVSCEYMPILNQLAGLRQAVDAFFNDVMVMVDDEALKNNRLAILSRLQALLMGVADISLLQLHSS